MCFDVPNVCNVELSLAQSKICNIRKFDRKLNYIRKDIRYISVHFSNTPIIQIIIYKYIGFGMGYILTSNIKSAYARVFGFPTAYTRSPTRSGT